MGAGNFKVALLEMVYLCLCDRESISQLNFKGDIRFERSEIAVDKFIGVREPLEKDGIYDEGSMIYVDPMWRMDGSY